MIKKNISLLCAALSHKCPACGKGDIYEKLLEVTRRCEKCGQNLREYDSVDGPVILSMIISGVIIAALALLAEIYLMLPLWLHIMLWIPAAIGIAILLLKIIKSYRISLKYRNYVDKTKGQ